MSIQREKKVFEVTKRIYESVLLKFHGVDGYDVYNCSIPFIYKGKTWMFGRVEKRDEWTASHVRLFEQTGKDEFTVHTVPNWELEDPYIAKVNGEMVFGGTHVRKNRGKEMIYYGYFYRGTPCKLNYYTSGPDNMKDIRVVQLADKRVGVFSRPRTSSMAGIGFTAINSMDELSIEVISNATPLNVLDKDTWGGVNQVYLLTNHKLGCIAHYSFKDQNEKKEYVSVYINFSFVLDPTTLKVEDRKVIGTMSCYPPCPCKKPWLTDCVFTSGIVMRDDGKCDLYSGVGDTHQGRITIDYPFQKYGSIVGDMNFDNLSPQHLSSL